MSAPGFPSNELEKEAPGFEKLSTDQGKPTPSTNPLKRGPRFNDIPDVAKEGEMSIQSPADGHQAKLSSGVPPGEGDSEFKRENASVIEDASRLTTPKPKLFDPEQDKPIASVTRRSKFPGQSNIGHLQNTRDLKKRQASSDVGGRRAMPQEFATPKRILQPTSRITRLEPPQSPQGQNQFDSSQEREAINDDPEPNIEMLRQPETRPISHDQLVVEVKGIYAGLVMVEAKCIDVDEKQSMRAQDDALRREPLKNDQWQSLIALHKQLLHEHHDFFLASQHPSASSNLSKLAAKYSMPARMWRHGIHAFLEVLRHRLPESLEHMLAFIYIAYSMMALLYETVSTFEDTWIECLGDLGRYRMAIEDDEPKDREVWSGVARFWYSKAADKNPTVGRLYHHLAILARPYTLEQLSFYTRSLTCITPFESARGSIMTLFNPILNRRESGYHKSSSMELLVIKAHGLLFLYTNKPLHDLDDIVDDLKNNKKGLINEFIEKSGARFKRIGVFLAVSNIAALFEFGALTMKGTHRSELRRIFDLSGDQKERTQDLSLETSLSQSTTSLTNEEIETSKVVVSYASDLTFSIFEIVLGETNWERNHILPMVHVMLVFIWCISLIPEAIDRFEKAIPWAAICSYLNHLKMDESWRDMLWDDKTFPSTAGTTGRPPPEDYIIRGQVYTQQFFPETWFIDAKVDDEERMLEQSSHDAYRKIRVFWLAARICSIKRWIKFDKETQTFTITKYTTENLSSTLEAANVSPKTEKLDENVKMDDFVEVVANDQDAVSDVATKETPVVDPFASSEVMDINESPYRSTSTTRTNTERTNNTDVTNATTIQPEGPTTPRATDLDEPEDTPMIDISPGRSIHQLRQRHQ